jgi:Uma2 family endonuclease
MIVALPFTTIEQRITLAAVPWSAYVAFCDGLGERYVRMTYYQGEMEIMSVSSKHEREKSRLRRVVEVVTEELEMDMEYGGSMTCRKEGMLCALEPDDCFWIEHTGDVLGLDDIDLDCVPPPDLAHEIEIRRRSAVACPPCRASTSISGASRPNSACRSSSRTQPPPELRGPGGRALR